LATKALQFVLSVGMHSKTVGSVAAVTLAYKTSRTGACGVL